MYKDKLWLKSMRICSKMGCHQRPDRSFFISNYQFPLCARCTGILLSYILGYIVCCKKKISIKVSIFLILPMIIDGLIQYIGIKESTNLRRFFTGILGGLGLVNIRIKFYFYIIKIIKDFFRKEYNYVFNKMS